MNACRAEFNPLTSRWMVWAADGSLIRGGLSKNQAFALVNQANTDAA